MDVEPRPSIRPVLLVALLFLASLVGATLTTSAGPGHTRPGPARLVRVVVDQPAAARTSAGSISP